MNPAWMTCGIFFKLDMELDLNIEEEKDPKKTKVKQAELAQNSEDKKQSLVKFAELEQHLYERIVDRVFMVFGKDAPLLILFTRVNNYILHNNMAKTENEYFWIKALIEEKIDTKIFEKFLDDGGDLLGIIPNGKKLYGTMMAKLSSTAKKQGYWRDLTDKFIKLKNKLSHFHNTDTSNKSLSIIKYIFLLSKDLVQTGFREIPV